MTPLRQVENAAVALVSAVAVGTLGYRLGGGVPAAAAFGAALAVLLVAAPSAMRLATATPLLVAASRAAQLGILLDGPGAAAAARRVDTVVLAGTGMLPGRELKVYDVHPAAGVAPDDALRLAGAVAQESDRPLERAVAVAAAWLPGVAEFDTVGDLGVRGIVAEVVTVDGDERVLAHAVLVGSVELLAVHDIALPAELAAARADADASGRIPVAVAWDGVARAVLVVGATVAASNVAAVRRLRTLGLRPVLLTGESEPAARNVAEQLGLDADAVIAEVAPEDEAAVVRRLQGAGARVAVVADGTHAAALDAADLAVGSLPTAHNGLTLVRGELPAAVDAIRIARGTATVASGNLVCVLFCLAATLPAAATGLWGPLLAGTASAAAAVIVMTNSLRLLLVTTGG